MPELSPRCRVGCLLVVVDINRLPAKPMCLPRHRVAFAATKTSLGWSLFATEDSRVTVQNDLTLCCCSIGSCHMDCRFLGCRLSMLAAC